METNTKSNMKKNYILLLILTCIYCIPLKSEIKDSILYILPDKVEVKLSEYIQSSKLENSRWKFYLTRTENSMYRIYVASFKGETTDYWYINTNRFVVIDTENFPLILDYDSMFSTKDPDRIGEYGKREGQILKTTFIYDGYNIIFDKNGKYLEEDFGIYKKE